MIGIKLPCGECGLLTDGVVSGHGQKQRFSQYDF